MNDTILCVSGPDGSGKSTLVAALARAIPESRVVTIWDLMADVRVQPMLASKGALQTFLGALPDEARALFLATCMKAALERAPTGVRVVDAYWYKYLASELALGADPARIAALGAMFPEPALTFRVELPPEVAAERKRGDFSPYECGLRAPTREHFVDFQARSAPLVRKLISEHAAAVVPLDGTLPQGQLLGEALSSLEAVLP